MEGMNTPEAARAITARRSHVQPTGTSFAQAIVNALWPWLQDRRALMILAAVVLTVGGVTLGWNWLVAAGLLPILISVLPCVAMCAIGLCAMRGNHACSTTGADDGRTSASATMGDTARRIALERDELQNRPDYAPAKISGTTTTNARGAGSIASPEREEKL